MDPFRELASIDEHLRHLMDTAQTQRERNLIATMGQMYSVLYHTVWRASDPLDRQNERARLDRDWGTDVRSMDAERERTRTYAPPLALP